MNRLFPSLIAGWLGGAVLAVLLIVPAVASEPPEPPVHDLGQLHVMMAPPAKPSSHWLGISFHVLHEAFGAQLGLPEGQGLLVDQVMPDAPAARADVKKHDIILKADGQPLKELQDLIGVVDAAKDGELSLEIIRGGKPITIKVKPEKRPETPEPQSKPPQDGILWLDELQKIAEDLNKRPGTLRPFNPGFQLYKPGVIVPRGAPIHAPLPGDLSITIKKQGGEPAMIDVKRGDESWSVDENGLDALPRDVAVHVERMLGSVSLDLHDGAQVKIESKGVLTRAFARPRVKTPDGEGRLEKRLDEMNRRIERMQEMMEDLRDRGPRKEPADRKKPEKKAPKAKQEQV